MKPSNREFADSSLHHSHSNNLASKPLTTPSAGPSSSSSVASSGRYAVGRRSSRLFSSWSNRNPSAAASPASSWPSRAVHTAATLACAVQGAVVAVALRVARAAGSVWRTAVGLLASVALFIYELLLDVVPHWLNSGFVSIAPTFLRQQTLQRAMEAATTYEAWRSAALELDKLQGNDLWKMGFESSDYDYMLLRDSLEALYQARKRDDRTRMAWLLRSTLHRDVAGMGNPKLFARCHVGTKDLIEQYVDEVVYQLYYLSQAEVPNMTDNDKISMFVEIRQAFGRSALLLSGGGGLGIHHFGVIKALHDLDLLPRILSGSSVGSLVAGLICTTPEEDLATVLDEERPALKNLHLISREGEPESFWSKLQYFAKHGVLADVGALKEACRANIGDVTFQEAYDRTRRILNITITPPNSNEAPRLLNYLTAPDVVIWSAACASCALTGLFEPVEILAKDASGHLYPWNPSGQTWSDGSIQSDIPMQRLSELFNVNHFIVCQVNPHVVPVLRFQRSRASVFLSWILSEARFRLDQLAAVFDLPRSLSNFRTILSQKYDGDITIVPQMTVDDYMNIVSNPTPDRFKRAIKVGQLATWPQVSLIQNHCKIELALDDIVHRLRGCERWSLQ